MSPLPSWPKLRWWVLRLFRTLLEVLLVIFFFFQAEDGIRDLIVTGVQTCALPICFFGLAKVVYGFEFTIPIHFARFAPWFHGNPKPAVVGNAAPSATGPVAAEVRVGGYRFTADSVVIAAGQTVRWVNADFVEHTITFDGAEPGSPLISPNGTWAHRFDRPGSYTYHCTPHPFMTGVVVVR